jgi:tight adherence protein C
MPLLFIAAAGFFVAATVAFAVVEGTIVERLEANRAIRRIRTLDQMRANFRERELAAPFLRRALSPMVRAAGRLGRKFTPASVVERLAKEIVAAGSPEGWDAERILALKLLGAGSGIAGGLALKFVGLAFARAFILAAILGVLGYYIPEWGLRMRSGKRQAAIRCALPDALDLLSITVEAGLGFDAAVSRVAKQAKGPLGEEFHRMLQEMQIGKPRAEALRDLASRSTLPELHSFVLAMVQADAFGISISKVLHVQAQELRLRRRQLAEEKAQKVPVKIVFPLIACIFPALFVVILGPAVITISHNMLHH